MRQFYENHKSESRNYSKRIRNKMTLEEDQDIRSFLISERIKKNFLFMSEETFKKEFEFLKLQFKIGEYPPVTDEELMYKGKKYVVKCVAVISFGRNTTYVIDPASLKEP